ncbi:MAG: biotin transporter BioY [Rectinemataceae bacterium]
MQTSRRIAEPVLACLFAALMSAGAYIAVPLPFSPVPIVLQNFFVFLAALVLEPTWAFTAALVYLALGAIGLPVFSGGSGGLSRLVGPTGGYLVAYPFAALIAALIARWGRRRRWKDVLALCLAALVVYACGMAWLRHVLHASWGRAALLGLLPFLPGDAIKIAAAALIGRRLSDLVTDLSGEDDG